MGSSFRPVVGSSLRPVVAVLFARYWAVISPMGSPSVALDFALIARLYFARQWAVLSPGSGLSFCGSRFRLNRTPSLCPAVGSSFALQWALTQLLSLSLGLTWFARPYFARRWAVLAPGSGQFFRPVVAVLFAR